MRWILFFLATLSLGVMSVSAQINNLEKKIIGIWYYNKTTTKDGKIIAIRKERIDTIYFYSNNTYKWVLDKDLMSFGTWKEDKTIKGIRLKEKLTKDMIDWYKSFGVTSEDLGRID